MKRNNAVLSRMFCCKCGKEGLPVPRLSDRHREAGHLKRLFCFNCQQEWNHAEVRDIFSDYNYEDFKLEMEYGNFDEEGNRKEPYREFRGKLINKGVVT